MTSTCSPAESRPRTSSRSIADSVICTAWNASSAAPPVVPPSRSSIAIGEIDPVLADRPERVLARDQRGVQRLDVGAVERAGVEAGFDLGEQHRGPVAVVREPGPADRVFDQRAYPVALAQLRGRPSAEASAAISSAADGRGSPSPAPISRSWVSASAEGIAAGRRRSGGHTIAAPTDHAHDAAHPGEF